MHNFKKFKCIKIFVGMYFIYSFHTALFYLLKHSQRIKTHIKLSYCQKSIFQPLLLLSRFIIVPLFPQWDFELRAGTGVKTEFCEVIIKTSEPNYFTARKWLGMRFYVLTLHRYFYGFKRQ